MRSVRLTAKLLDRLALARKTAAPLRVRLCDISDHCHQPVTYITYFDTLRLRQPVSPLPSQPDLVFETDSKTIYTHPYIFPVLSITHVLTPDVYIPPLLCEARLARIKTPDGLDYGIVRIPHPEHPRFYGFCTSPTAIDSDLGPFEPYVPWSAVALAVYRPEQFDRIHMHPSKSSEYSRLAIGPDNLMYRAMSEYF